MKHIVTALAIVLPIAAAHADHPPSGYELYSDCVSSSEADNISCLSYVAGVADALIIEDKLCGVGDLKAGNTTMIYVTWARNHPEHLSKSRGLTVDASLRSAYPCGQATPRTSSAPSFLRQ